MFRVSHKQLHSHCAFKTKVGCCQSSIVDAVCKRKTGPGEKPALPRPREWDFRVCGRPGGFPSNRQSSTPHASSLGATPHPTGMAASSGGPSLSSSSPPFSLPSDHYTASAKPPAAPHPAASHQRAVLLCSLPEALRRRPHQGPTCWVADPGKAWPKTGSRSPWEARKGH